MKHKNKKKGDGLKMLSNKQINKSRKDKQRAIRKARNNKYGGRY